MSARAAVDVELGEGELMRRWWDHKLVAITLEISPEVSQKLKN